MPWRRPLCVEVTRCSICFLDSRAVSFHGFGKFSSTICVNRLSIPLFLSSSSNMSIIFILFFLMESDSSHVVISFFFYVQVSPSLCIISRVLSLISLIHFSIWSAVFPMLTSSFLISFKSSTCPKFLFSSFVKFQSL